jgi:hypothetical protein
MLTALIVVQQIMTELKGAVSGDLNAKHPSWNSTVSNPSGEKLLQLFDASDF